MRTINKFELAICCEQQNLSIPLDAKLLLMHYQGGTIYMSFEVQTNNPLTERRFVVYWLDQPIGQSCEHVGSILAPPFEFHVYEIPA